MKLLREANPHDQAGGGAAAWLARRAGLFVAVVLFYALCFLTGMDPDRD